MANCIALLAGWPALEVCKDDDDDDEEEEEDDDCVA
jgi:hypothetical protein